MEARSVAEEIAERDRLLGVVLAYRRGEVGQDQLPPDAATYPGRIVELNQAIEEKQSWEREYDRQMAEAEKAAFQASRQIFAEQAPRSFSAAEQLFEAASNARRWVRQEAEERVDFQLERYPVLSQDDWIDATIRGGDRAVNEYFVEQKQAHGFRYGGEENTVEQAQENETQTQDLTRKIGEHLAARWGEIDRDWRSVSVASGAESGAATNYFRGRAEEWNATREAVLRSHPHLESDLPAPIQVDEIRVRQVVLEQEREHEKSLAIAR